MSKHYAVDFHKTLAKYDPETQQHEDFDNLKPVKKMVKRVKTWLAQGDKVTVFCADATPENDWDGRITRGIQSWTENYIGEKLPVTAIKSPDFDEIWDDKGVAIEPNTGKCLSKKPKKDKQ